ncbi:MAG: LysM peptidoglycan-binding domain-containing protein, partial [Acutalibacteraceae bacterium]
LKCIGNSKPLFPIFYDMEEDEQARLGKSLCTDIAVAFCSTIEKAGYKAGVYANAYWFENYLDYDKLSKSYAIWLAQWADKPQFSSELWQYTSKGKIDGISGNVDMNYMDGDFFNTYTKGLENSKKDKPSANDDAKKDNTSKISLNKAELYVSSNADKPSGTVSGIYWLWDNEVINGRRRITNSKSNIGKDGQVTGWINQSAVSYRQYENYTVKVGDTLWGIAEKLLGKGSSYKEIKTLNGLKSDVITAGQVLKIPEK